VGRETGQVRLRVVKDTTGQTLSQHVHQYTIDEAISNTDDYQSYNPVQRERDIVCHSHHWARDDDGDGFFEVHTNTVEGMWAAVRTFLRVFRGVHKRYLSGYIAMCEFSINLKRITPDFISALVRWQFQWA
jgi:transposase